MIGHIPTLQKLLVMVALVVSATFAHGESADSPSKAYWICKSKKQVRTVRVVIDEHSGICTTYYQRDGAEKSVGSGKNHESCMRFLESIKTNLEKSNWSCRDISSTAITSVQQ